MTADADGISFQCMDTTHAMLADSVLPSSWFTSYDCADTVVWGLSLKDLTRVLGCRSKLQTVAIEVEKGSDSITVRFSDGDKADFPKEFIVPQYDFQIDRLEIPETEHDVDLVLDSARFVKLLTELETFGNETQVQCSDDEICFRSKDGPISMQATLPQTDMVEYALPEDGVDEVFASRFLVVAAGFATLTKFASVPKTMQVHFNASRPAWFVFTLGAGATAPSVSTMVAPRVSDADE